MIKYLVVALTVGVAMTLLGCGGSGGEESGKNATATATIMASTTSLPSANATACDSGNAGQCAQWLNALYMGYDENNANSPLGVSLRGRPRFDQDGQWFFCNGKCFKGQPDCYTASALINHKIMITKDSKLKLVMDDPVYIIFKPEAAEKHIIKCAYQYDGAAFNKRNGGCGMGGPNVCTDPTSAYMDQCPDDKTKHGGKDCPTDMESWCGTKTVDYPSTCFWKGPAFDSPAWPDAKPDPNPLPDNQIELRKMMNQRIKSQSQDKHTNDKLYTLTEYWNEITMDGRIIQRYLDKDPTEMIAAFGYYKGNKAAQAFAQQFNDDLKKKHGKSVPIVTIDMVTPVTSGKGPFGTVAEDSITSELLSF